MIILVAHHNGQYFDLLCIWSKPNHFLEYKGEIKFWKHARTLVISWPKRHWKKTKLVLDCPVVGSYLNSPSLGGFSNVWLTPDQVGRVLSFLSSMHSYFKNSTCLTRCLLDNHLLGLKVYWLTFWIRSRNSRSSFNPFFLKWLTNLIVTGRHVWHTAGGEGSFGSCQNTGRCLQFNQVNQAVILTPGVLVFKTESI